MTEELPKFDPDLLPDHENNRKAADARGWRFERRKKYYVDEDGCLMADKFGQPL